MANIRLPDPPAEYDRAYMEQLINQINLQLRALNAIVHVTGADLHLTRMPTSAAGLRSGDVWVDTGAANVLKQVP